MDSKEEEEMIVVSASQVYFDIDIHSINLMTIFYFQVCQVTKVNKVMTEDMVFKV